MRHLPNKLNLIPHQINNKITTIYAAASAISEWHTGDAPVGTRNVVESNDAKGCHFKK